MIAELRILGERIVIAPEHVEKLLKCHSGRVVDDLDRFGMAGIAAHDVFIFRIGDVTPDIAGRGAEDAVDLVEIGLDAPEAAAGEGELREAS